MSAIVIKFERLLPSLTNHTFENVVNVTWSHEYVREFMVDGDSEIGHKITNFKINGFIRRPGDPSDNVAQQEALENALRAVGTGTLSYTGAADITDARFVSLEFAEYRGATVSRFTASFVTEAANVAAHDPVSIGGQALTIAEGFELPSIEDIYGTQGPDERLDHQLKRKLSITGRIVADTILNVNTIQEKLVVAIRNKDSVVVGWSDGNGGYLLNMRPRELSFGSPEQRLGIAARTYTFECETHDDYAKEPYTIGHLPLTFLTGGTAFTIDVVESIDHTVTTEREGIVYSILEESASVSGKKYFKDWDEYNTFVQSWTPFPIGRVTDIYKDPSSINELQLEDISIGAFTRDGNYPLGTAGLAEAKRFSATISLQFKWMKSVSLQTQHFNTQILGITWFKIDSTNHSFTVDSLGFVTSRTVSFSGQMFDGQLTDAKSKLGTSQSIGIAAGIDDGGLPYFITSVSVSGTDIRTIDATFPPTLTKVHDVSISATQLETASQKTYFLKQVFNIKNNATDLIFERVTSRSKSISNKFITDPISTHAGKYKVVSINMTVSGEVWENDLNGAPSDVNRAYKFFDIFDATQETTPNDGGPPNYIPDYPGATPLGGDPKETLPSNYNFFLTSISIGEWQPAVHPTTGARHWRQSVSLNATVIFDISGSNSASDPDFIDTEGFAIAEQFTKFTELRVMGFGLKFKAIGIEPSTAQTTLSRQFKSKTVLKTNNPQRGTRTPTIPSFWPFGSDNEITKDTFQTNGLTVRWVKAWKATKEA